MVYKVIGLMSGSSLDGLDIVFTQLEEIRGQWSFEIIHAECLPYNEHWHNDLRAALQKDVGEFLKLHSAYGRYLGEQINAFIERHNIHHQVAFIASHGHTAFHDPANNTTFQIGDGSAIAAVTGLPVISDLRSLDVALGGQGAPIVPIGDKLLFSEYDYLLNIGGIANITVPHNGALMAFDICPANQMLNALAVRCGKDMDEGGEIAKQGIVLIDVLAQLNEEEYYQRQPPKSLSNEAAMALVFPDLLESKHSVEDMMRTAVEHIADKVAEAVKRFPVDKEQKRMLVTGGGAFNTFLIEQIKQPLGPLGVEIIVPDPMIVNYKEALVMALIGALRWREENNVLSSVTGASRDSIGGAMWMGHSYSMD